MDKSGRQLKPLCPLAHEMLRFLLFIVILCFLILPVDARAQQGFLGLSLGGYNVSRTNNREISFRLEYRAEKPVLFQRLKPWAGLELTSKASVWGGAGLMLDLKVADRVFLSPSLGLGLYARGNSETNLDFPLQFRSQFEISYVFQNEGRLGIAVSHMSNAGLGEHNGGVEILMLSYIFPISRFFNDFL